MSEQSPQANSQTEVQTPQQHERAIEERISNLLEPQTENEEKKEPEVKEEAPAEDSQEQPEVKAEEKEEVKEELPEVVDAELDGKTYKVPQAVKDAMLRQSDYTKKTQEAAEARKNADALLQQATQVLELQKSQYKQLGQLASLDEQIAQYEKVDWNTLTAQDATKAQQLFIAFQQAKDARVKVVGELNQLHSQQMDAANKARQAKLEEGHKALSSRIKGWNADLGRKILASTTEAYGAPQELLAQITDPWAVEALHDAMQWRQLQASKPAIEKKAPVQTKTLKPSASEQRSPAQQGYDQDRRALRSAKDSTEMSKAAERLILRKLG